VRAVSPGSIDKTTVAMDSGEMSFGIFQYNEIIESVVMQNKDSFSKLKELHDLLKR